MAESIGAEILFRLVIVLVLTLGFSVFWSVLRENLLKEEIKFLKNAMDAKMKRLFP